MLFNYFNIYFLIVLRVPPTHTTPAFSDLKVDVYGMKGGRLWDGRWTFMGWKVDVYGIWDEGGRLWDEPQDAP